MINNKKINPTPAGSKKHADRTKFYPLLIVDNDPIRKKYIQAFKKISRELDRAKADWTAYEKEDKPAFRKWLNSTLGKELTLLRDTRDKVCEMEQLLDEIEDCKYRKRMTYYQAYEFVMKRRANPEHYMDGNTHDEDFDDEPCEEFSDDPYCDFDDEYTPDDEELRELFLSFLESNDPALRRELLKNKQLFEKVFLEFKENFFSNRPGTSSSGKNENNEESADTRIKELYRELVRKLHPDSRKETNERYDEIWYEVQEAYLNKNFERMEMLAALCDIHSGCFYETGSLSQLLKAQQEYKLQLKSLKSQTRSVKGDPAWGFSKKNDTGDIEKYIRRDLTESAEYLKYKLTEMEIILSRWSNPPKKTTSGTKAKPKPVIVRTPDDEVVQMEIPF